jgi:hypothetical protein
MSAVAEADGMHALRMSSKPEKRVLRISALARAKPGDTA